MAVQINCRSDAAKQDTNRTLRVNYIISSPFSFLQSFPLHLRIPAVSTYKGDDINWRKKNKKQREERSKSKEMKNEWREGGR